MYSKAQSIFQGLSFFTLSSWYILHKLDHTHSSPSQNTSLHLHRAKLCPFHRLQMPSLFPRPLLPNQKQPQPTLHIHSTLSVSLLRNFLCSPWYYSCASATNRQEQHLALFINFSQIPYLNWVKIRFQPLTCLDLGPLPRQHHLIPFHPLMSILHTDVEYFL